MESRRPANLAEFEGAALATTLAAAKRGIRSPTPVDLDPSQYAKLYRLGHSTLSDELNLTSPWWSDYQAYRTMTQFAETNRITLTKAGRIGNAMTPEFGPADTLFTIWIKAPLRALQGVALPQTYHGWTFGGLWQVTQTFVPGLRGSFSGTRSSAARAIIGMYSTTPLETNLFTLYGE